MFHNVGTGSGAPVAVPVEAHPCEVVPKQGQHAGASSCPLLNGATFRTAAFLELLASHR